MRCKKVPRKMKESAKEKPIRETDRGHVTGKILQLTLEIIYLLTGEDYGPIKKETGKPPSPSLTLERNNDKKILEVTQQIIELLTGEVPIKCQDVTGYFSSEEWKYMDEHKDLYKDAMMENRPPLTSPDLIRATGTSEDGETRQTVETTDDQALKSFKSEQKSTVVSDSTLQGDKDLLKNRDHTLPCPTLCPATNIKQEPSEGDGFIITKLQISTEQGCSLAGGQNDPAGRVKTAVRKRKNGGLKTSKSLDGSHSNSPKVKKTKKKKKAHKCQQCGESFTSDSKLSKHQLNHTRAQDFICSACGKCFFTESELGDHLESHINGKIPNDKPLDSDSVACSLPVKSEPFRCHYCGESFDGKMELATHQLVHFKNPYTCKECGRNFLSKSGLVTHQKTHSMRFDCPTCGKSFLSGANLLLHQEVHLNLPGLAPETEAASDDESDIIVRQIDGRYSCTECGEFFNTKASFPQHRKTHLVKCIYVCPECGKVFKRKANLDLHQKVIHESKLSFTCLVCNKVFTCHSELGRHSRVHTREQPYTCTECGKCFSFKSALVRHQKIHSGIRPCYCSICGNGFSCKSALLRHVAIHMKENVLI
ncbi:uncharacterized protein ACMZJ9_015387 [Mantella aurantiaca]